MAPLQSSPTQHRAVHLGLRGLRATAGWVTVVLTVVGGVGMLYLLHSLGALAAGPGVHGALPLQQLAGNETQPLLRMIVAWVPAGTVAGLGLLWLTRVRPAPGVAGIALLCAVLLVIAKATSDAVAVSVPFASRLAPALGRPAIWVAVICMAAGALPALLIGRPGEAPEERVRSLGLSGPG